MEEILNEFYGPIGLATGLATVVLAWYKKRNPLAWGLFGLFLFAIPIPLVILALLPRICPGCGQKAPAAKTDAPPATAPVAEGFCPLCGQARTKTAGARKKGVMISALAALVLIPGGCFYLEKQAASQAKAFCARAIVGQPVAALAKEAETTGERMLRTISDSTVAVGFIGIPPFSRHQCVIRVEAGEIKGAAVRHID